MFFEIAPDFYINGSQIVQFKLIRSPERGGYVWVFTLTSGKVLFSIPFRNETDARDWLRENLLDVKFLPMSLREHHRGYKAE